MICHVRCFEIFSLARNPRDKTPPSPYATSYTYVYMAFLCVYNKREIVSFCTRLAHSQSNTQTHTRHQNYYYYFFVWRYSTGKIFRCHHLEIQFISNHILDKTDKFNYPFGKSSIRSLFFDKNQRKQTNRDQRILFKKSKIVKKIKTFKIKVLSKFSSD